MLRNSTTSISPACFASPTTNAMNKPHTQIAFSMLLLANIASFHPASAQHLGDVQLRLEGEQLTTGNNRIFTNEFDDFGGTLFTDDPGFEAQSGALPAGVPIGFNVLQSLWYWDGAQLLPPPLAAKIKVSLGPVSPVFVSGRSGPQTGFTIQTASSSGTIHTHPSYTLSPGDAPYGVYGVVLEATSPPYQPSLPFLFAFNYGLQDLDKVFAGVDAIALAAGITEPLDIPGDTDDDGDVDLEDLNNVRNQFGQSGESILGDTLPFDGAVDLTDLNNVRNHFGATSAVPEPPAALLCIAALTAIAVARRCRRS